MNYPNPMISDSGGFQVFSLGEDVGHVKDGLKGKQKKRYMPNAPPNLVKIKEEGAIFRNYRDGNLITLTPESSVLAQKKIGADIVLPLDWLLPQGVDEGKLVRALELTHRWETRSLETHLKHLNNQAMYGIIHGGTNLELRKWSIQFLSNLPFQGLAIGGSLGHTFEDVKQLLEGIHPYVPSHFPTHLLGIGDMRTIKASVKFGMDTFDSCLPSRLGRHGILFFTNDSGEDVQVDITNQMYKSEVERKLPYTPEYSFAALHHLLKQHEPVGMFLGTFHNISWTMEKMREMRENILKDKF
eukprot:TRINITY_DN9119_c0_g1_i1.p1 TRINITY_DN9119_c0_g1~~TRINITY_DN9119_c0_g1_i1.p1  ORF type:complete len:299 (-),score=74.11 TRINITY_DN9119_c0_g1_i1:227-1123(-)